MTQSAFPVTSVGIAPPGYRLPATTRLGAVRLQVGSLASSLTYYERALGLHLLRRTERDAVLGTPDQQRPLVELHEGRSATPVPRQARLGLYHYAVLLPNRAALGCFITHLEHVGIPFGASDHLVSEALYLRDPDGLGIEVYVDRPRERWQSTDRQLRMNTTPLDLAAVVDAAKGVQWTGMPAGSTIGHVHLHVAALDAAAAFYHDALGFDKTVWSYPGALFLSAGGYHHHVGLNTWAGPAAQPPRDHDAQLLEWRLELPTDADVRATRASVETAGYRTADALDGWTVPDPWGTVLRLTSPQVAAFGRRPQ